jgi:hypothetical protein
VNAGSQVSVSSDSAAEAKKWSSPSLLMPFTSSLLAASIPAVLAVFLAPKPVLQAHALTVPPTKAPTIVAASPETSSNLNPREASPEPKKQPPRYIPGRSALEQIRITELAAQDITKALDPSLREAYNQIVQEMIRDVREGNEPSRHQNIRRMNQFLIDNAPAVFEKFGPQTKSPQDSFPVPPGIWRPRGHDGMTAQPNRSLPWPWNQEPKRKLWLRDGGGCSDPNDIVQCS